MTGAIFDAVCTAPWGFAVPSMERAAPLLSPGTERLIGYHLVVEGKALVRLKDAAEVPWRPAISPSFRTGTRTPSRTELR